MSKELKPKDKKKMAPLRILEKAIELFVMDGALGFPTTNDPVDVTKWIHVLTLNLVHAVRRKDMVGQHTYAKLSNEEKFELLVKVARKKTDETLKIEKRMSEAASALGMELPEGPPPLPPQEEESLG